MKLTERNTVGLKLEGGKSDCIWWDDDVAGFGIRLRAGGSRNWIYRYRIGSKQRSLILGSAKSVPLSLARKNAIGLEARVRLGGDPALDRQTAKLEADNTFGVLAHQFLEARKSEWRPGTYKEIERQLLKYAKSLHRLPISAVSQHNIASLLNTIAKEAGDVTANRLRGSLCSLFGWVIREGVRLPEGNVASYTNKRQEKARDRVLSDTELKTIWNACGDDEYGVILKLLILTAQRANEIAGLRWDEVHDEQIILPSQRTKNKRTHIVPLSDPAKTIFAGFQRGDRTHVFGRIDTGFQGWHVAKKVLNSRIAGKPLAHWTPHDLRRTVATRMAELGVQPHIIEAVLNHVSGHKGGVAGIYNRATYDKEKTRGAEPLGRACDGHRRGPRGDHRAAKAGVSAVTPEEEWPEEWPEITPEEENYIRDEGLALQLLSDFLHVPSPEVKDGKLVLVGGKSTEDEARRALCRILLDEEWGPSAEVCHALVAVFDPDATDAALKAVLKRRSRGHANPYADGAIAEAVSLLRFRGKHYDDAIAEVAAKFGKSAEHVKRIFGKGARPLARLLPRRPRRKGSIR